MRASGTVNIGAINAPATAADFARVNLDDVDFSDLQSCRSGKCDFRMPPSYLDRFQKEVNWKAPDARTQAATLARALVAEYVPAYQKGGDNGARSVSRPAAAESSRAAVPGHAAPRDQGVGPGLSVRELPGNLPGKQPTSPSIAFMDADNIGRKPVFTLHHVAIQAFPDGACWLPTSSSTPAAYRCGGIIALAIPTADQRGFDLIVSVKARADAVSGAPAACSRTHRTGNDRRAENLLRVDSRQPRAETRRSRAN